MYLYTTPKRVVAVRVFPGYADSWQDEVLPELRKLAAAVTAANIRVPNGQETISQYDGPFQLFFRHNEVWLDVIGPIPRVC